MAWPCAGLKSTAGRSWRVIEVDTLASLARSCRWTSGLLRSRTISVKLIIRMTNKISATKAAKRRVPTEFISVVG